MDGVRREVEPCKTVAEHNDVRACLRSFLHVDWRVFPHQTSLWRGDSRALGASIAEASPD